MMLSVARAKVHQIASRDERRAQRLELYDRMLVVREGTCAERWGAWGHRERLQNRPKL